MDEENPWTIVASLIFAQSRGAITMEECHKAYFALKEFVETAGMYDGQYK